MTDPAHLGPTDAGGPARRGSGSSHTEATLPTQVTSAPGTAGAPPTAAPSSPPGDQYLRSLTSADRRQHGAHYTTDHHIVALLHTLLLSELRATLQAALSNHQPRQRRELLADLHDTMCGLTLLDPACGCGSFLVVAFRELSLLEREVLQAQQRCEPCEPCEPNEPSEGAPIARRHIQLSQFRGIEVQPRAAELAGQALLQAHHQYARTGGGPADNLDADSHPIVWCANALEVDWGRIAPNRDGCVLLGNPPFVGKQSRSPAQIADMRAVFAEVPRAGQLDYAAAWFQRAASYMTGTRARAAFLCTNSIAQGEQPGILWPLLHSRYGTSIRFAYRSFPWQRADAADASVHVVIIGFSSAGSSPKTIYPEPPDATGRNRGQIVSSINPYLVAGASECPSSRRRPLCASPPATFGNMPNDGGHLLLDAHQRQLLLDEEPALSPYVRRFVSAREYLSGNHRYCLWLVDAPAELLEATASLRHRLEQVRTHRQRSGRPATRSRADTPELFGEIRQPLSRYLLIPRHVSARRRYLPLGYFEPHEIAADSCICIDGADSFHFGVLSSRIHLAWMELVCGRIKSDFRYSIQLVYNNFPWPVDASAAAIGTVRHATGRMQAARAAYGDRSLAQLYKSSAIPPPLRRAHDELDAAVERCYQQQRFSDDYSRASLLLHRWSQLRDAAPAERGRRP